MNWIAFMLAAHSLLPCGQELAGDCCWREWGDVLIVEFDNRVDFFGLEPFAGELAERPAEMLACFEAVSQ